MEHFTETLAYFCCFVFTSSRVKPQGSLLVFVAPCTCNSPAVYADDTVVNVADLPTRLGNSDPDNASCGWAKAGQKGGRARRDYKVKL